MAQFDVYRRPGSNDLLLDCQSDLLSGLPTRFLVPLLAATDANISAWLNPALEVDGTTYILVPQLALSAPVERIGKRIGSLAREHYKIVRAIDVLLGGV